MPKEPSKHVTKDSFPGDKQGPYNRSTFACPIAHRFNLCSNHTRNRVNLGIIYDFLGLARTSWIFSAERDEEAVDLIGAVESIQRCFAIIPRKRPRKPYEITANTVIDFFEAPPAIVLDLDGDRIWFEDPRQFVTGAS